MTETHKRLAEFLSTHDQFLSTDDGFCTTYRLNLTERIAASDGAWALLSSDRRVSTRELFVAAGWTICPHPSCPPWSCHDH